MQPNLCLKFLQCPVFSPEYTHRFDKALTLKAPNTTIAEFANTADPDETAHNEPSHLDLQCLPSKV